MNDYFFKMVDARGEISASTVCLQNMVEALESDNDLLKGVVLKLAKEQIETNQTLLSSDIHA